MNSDEQVASGNRIIRIKQVLEITGFSRTTLWRMRKSNSFPKAVQLGDSIIGWYERDIHTWIKSLPESN